MVPKLKVVMHNWVNKWVANCRIHWSISALIGNRGMWQENNNNNNTSSNTISVAMIMQTNTNERIKRTMCFCEAVLLPIGSRYKVLEWMTIFWNISGQSYKWSMIVNYSSRVALYVFLVRTSHNLWACCLIGYLA